MPSLSDLVGKMTTNFRAVYTPVLADWLGLPGKEAVGGAFERPALFRS
jgi:hypothetical protein